MRSCTGSVVFLSGLLAAGVSLGAAAVPLETLVANSPFGSAIAGTPAAGSLEFRGWFTEGGEHYFSVYDPARRRAVWLRRGLAEGPLLVRGFDAAQESLAVEYQGRPLQLPLKVAQVGASPAAAPRPAAATPGAPAPAASAPAAPLAPELEEQIARMRQLQAYEARRKAQTERLQQARESRRKAP